MNCLKCQKNIDNLYWITKKPYCSDKCEKEYNDFPFNSLFNKNANNKPR